MAKNKQKETKTVTTVSEFFQALKEIVQGMQGSDFLYRGHADCGWELESSAYRRLTMNRADEDITPAVLQDYLEKLLDATRMRGFREGSGKKFSDLELLAQLQHYGAATCFIDFTKNALIALWFACQSSKAKKANKEKDGRVIIISATNPNKFPEITAKILGRDISYFLAGDTLWQWSPKYHLNRIVAKNSVFVFGKNNIDTDTDGKLYKTINIAKGSKQDILATLKDQSGIDESYLFSDFAGFASLNAHDKEYKVHTATDYIHFGVINHQKRAFSKAIKDYDQAITLDPQYAEAYYNRGLAKGAQGRHEEAIHDFTQAIAINSKYVEVYYNRGFAKYKLGRNEEAIEDYDQTIALDSKHVYAYNNRGIAKGEMGNYAEAIQDYDRAIALDSKDAIAYNNRGLAKGEMGNYAEAIKDYDQAIAINPREASAYNNRGLAKFESGEHEEAIKDFDQAIKLDSTYIDAYNNRGDAKSALGRHKEAIQDYDQAIELDTQYAEAYSNRGHAKIALGRYAEKISGLTESALGRYKEAIQDYDQVIVVDSKFAQAYNNRGIAKRALGYEKAAQQDFAMAEKLQSERD